MIQTVSLSQSHRCTVALPCLFRADATKHGISHLAEAGAVGVQLIGRNYQAVAVIIDVANIYQFVALAKDSQLAALHGAEKVREKEGIPRAVHLHISHVRL